MAIVERVLFLYLMFLAAARVMISSAARTEERLINPSQLEMFVDELPDMPKIKGYYAANGVVKPKKLEIGMFEKKWVSTINFIIFILSSIFF